MAHKRRTQKKYGGNIPTNMSNSEVRRLSFLAAREGRQLNYNNKGNPIIGNVASSILESRRPSGVEEVAIGIPEEEQVGSMPKRRALLSGRSNRSASPAARVRVVPASRATVGGRRRTHRRRKHTYRRR